MIFNSKNHLGKFKDSSKSYLRNLFISITSTHIKSFKIQTFESNLNLFIKEELIDKFS